MTDIIREARRRSQSELREMADETSAASPEPTPEELYWYVEALFFAYRDFTGDPDRLLVEIGFGRAHHRVLHFVHRYPGMRVADLLDILQITKQSLARVLRELIKEGYVTQLSGQTDKRERLLYVTDEGAALAKQLAAPQIERIRKALALVGRESDPAVARFLNAMIGNASRLPDRPEGEARQARQQSSVGKE